ncbi:hypothetical protein [Rhodococcus erythropolis]|uniref:hypothetical protein n=1 Tax=Rhodococcus erythropolis TaxID=1833 RepID=UPI0036DD7A5C
MLTREGYSIGVVRHVESVRHVEPYQQSQLSPKQEISREPYDRDDRTPACTAGQRAPFGIGSGWGEIEIYVPDEEGFGLEGISLVTREQLAERLPSSPDNPDEGELRIAAESLSEMIAELGG